MQLITGGSGFLGVRLAKRLLMEGKGVRVYDLNRSQELPSEIEFIRGDIRDIQTLKKACEGISVIYHLVGIMPQSRAKHEVMQAINVGGTHNVLLCAQEHGIKKIIYLSSNEVYGDIKNIPFKEDAPKNPIGEYGRNKIESEKLCKEFSDKYGIDIAILRPSTLVGPGISERLYLRFLKMASRGKTLYYLGNGGNRFQMTHVEDCVDACILSASKDGFGCVAFNIGADNTLPMKEQIYEFIKRSGIKSRVCSLPIKPVRACLSLLNIFGLSPLEPDHYKLMDRDIVMDCTRAKEMLNWNPHYSNVDMIVETIEWYRDKMKKDGLN